MQPHQAEQVVVTGAEGAEGEAEGKQPDHHTDGDQRTDNTPVAAENPAKRRKQANHRV